MKKYEIEYAVAMAIHSVAVGVDACGGDCDHIDEARAAIKAYRRCLSKKPRKGGSK